MTYPDGPIPPITRIAVPSSVELIVTGTGRCGTGYAAKMLTACGLPTGHKDLYNPKVLYAGAPETTAGMPGESSWLAAPDVPVLPQRIKVVHIVRDPLEVVRSMVGIGWLDSPYSPHHPYQKRALEGLGWPYLSDARGNTAELALRACLFIERWYSFINADLLAHNRVSPLRVEDFTITTAQKIVEWTDRKPRDPQPHELPPKDYNSQKREEAIDVRDLTRDLRHIRLELGYE